ncbi:MAG: YbjQ family protein [Gemmatimonadetes bacterium]|nr:YbjQ family protein [Gemmatimonadota bacterium]
MVVINFPRFPFDVEIERADMVMGSVVVSHDHFKRFLAQLRIIVGGRIKSYEPLLDRARREAVLRMKEQALAHGHNTVVNIRLETSRLANSRRGGKGTAGVEMLAYGTALTTRKGL